MRPQHRRMKGETALTALNLVKYSQKYFFAPIPLKALGVPGKALYSANYD
jgi:hypothetical protein